MIQAFVPTAAFVALSLASVSGVVQPIAAAPLPQCGGINENPQECSREGRQGGIPGGWRLPVEGAKTAHSCPSGSLRDCFPADRVGFDGRGSGRIVLSLMAAGLWV